MKLSEKNILIHWDEYFDSLGWQLVQEKLEIIAAKHEIIAAMNQKNSDKTILSH